MEKYIVTTALRLRKTADKSTTDNIITVLPKDTIVTAVAASQFPGWLNVSARVNNLDFAGFVSSAYTNPVADVQEQTSDTVEAVHLPIRAGVNIKRTQTSGRAYALNEVNMPARDATATEEQRRAKIYEIIRFLDVEKSARYRPIPGATYCNIYAYDFCCLSNVYLPRVWWSGKSLIKLSGGQKVPVVYADTVNEINANSLYNWFNDFGDDFGWTRIMDANTLQEEVNKGKTGIIVAQRKDLSRSGHIVGVIPETPDHRAVRAGAVVTVPLQSQAGSRNKMIFAQQWYTSNVFRGFSFWVHD